MNRAQCNLWKYSAAVVFLWLLTMSDLVAQGHLQTGVQVDAEFQRRAKLEQIVSHLTETQYKNRSSIRSYVATRQYKLFDDKSAKADSEVLAEVSFLPPGTKNYSITRTQGSGRGEKVVRKVLEHEQEMAGEWEDSAITERNYKFELAGEEFLNGQRCLVLKIEPKRQTKELIRGKAWIDALTYNVRRISGNPAKNPSWWVKRVELTLTFSDVDGMWLQTGATANADVRFFGKHMLTAHDVSHDTSDMVARAPRVRNGAPSRVVGAATAVR